ncbi:MAG: hypothetical protein WED05_00505 [Candidatus Atabeyarchaeum deiterrae]
MAVELKPVYGNTWVNESSVPPRITFTVNFEPLRETIYLLLAGGTLYLTTSSSGRVEIGRVYSREMFIALFGGREPRRLELHFDVDPWKLEKIEQIRAGSDLMLQLILHFHKKRENEPTYQMSSSMIVTHPEYGEQIKIAKSDWVENYLPKLGYRRSRILEIPMLEPTPEDFRQVPLYLDEAWKHYSRCDCDDVMTNCRRALESLTEAIKKLGFKKTEPDESGRERTVPNWKSFFGEHGTLAENFEKTFRGTIGFLQPGAHTGRAISGSEAEFALMSTYSLSNYVIKTNNKSRGK